MSALGYLWHKHKGALIALALALVVTLFFAVRIVAQWIYWTDPAHRDQQIEGWMTAGYIAHSYAVPRDVIRDALPADVPTGKHMPLDRIAAENGIRLTVLIDGLYAAIEAERAAIDR
ncbi:hypothetical protein [Actibacterium pelagium]|uniref:Uncharacterized protein n=1 Tax=Actibacterium pelagium TaxID=2029103 RepID=A0A917ADF6_9RHOB|nr:hypothetical protein [Actibacterium pelagium]GGE44865.1 hypothetical protein GCM10011517_10580 [Actibacterium pelagium]